VEAKQMTNHLTKKKTHDTYGKFILNQDRQKLLRIFF